MTLLAIIFGSLLAAALWELLRPRRELEFPAWRRRLGNLAIWLLNLILAGLVFTPPAGSWPLAPIPSFAAGFLLLDLLSYLVHRCQHAVPFLWRLHALHHSDPDVDVTTAVRHHPIEFIISTAVFWFAVLVIGIPGIVVLAHGTTTFVLAAITHANSRLPAWMERTLSPVIITVDLHLVHHSSSPADLNTNFGAVLSVWDRLFGTLHPAVDVERFGVADLPRADACKLSVMLMTPWRLP
jgi:sterol desaturase/sphingolipid hydroxylase (fatty acid hydroxylase superfamily)